MSPRPTFALAEAVVIAGVAGLDGVTGVSTVTPPDLENQLAYIRVRRIGGSDDIVTDSARLDVDAFAASEYDAAVLAETIRATVHDFAHHVIGGRLIDRVRTEAGPASLDYDNPAVHRYVATYVIDSRVAR